MSFSPTHGPLPQLVSSNPSTGENSWTAKDVMFYLTFWSCLWKPEAEFSLRVIIQLLHVLWCTNRLPSNFIWEQTVSHFCPWFAARSAASGTETLLESLNPHMSTGGGCWMVKVPCSSTGITCWWSRSSKRAECSRWKPHPIYWLWGLQRQQRAASWRYRAR